MCVCVSVFRRLQSFTTTPFTIEKALLWTSGTTERVVLGTTGDDGNKGGQSCTVGLFNLDLRFAQNADPS